MSTFVGVRVPMGGATVGPMVAVITPPLRYRADELARVCAAIEAAAFDGIWSGEVNNVDAVSTAAIAATATHRCEVAAVLNVFTRAPSTLAMTAATLADAAPERAAVVLGVASPLLVERYNGIAYERPLDRLRDILRFLRLAFEGGRVRGDFATFRTGGFGFTTPLAVPPRLYVASSGPRSMAFAAAHADAVVVNWVGPDDLDRLPELPADRARVLVQVMVCPTADADVFDATMRPLVADYLCAPAYAGLQRRLGRGELLEPMWNAFAQGDRAGVHRALPRELLDFFVISGTPDECRRRLAAVRRATGCRVVVALFPPQGEDFIDGIHHAAIGGTAGDAAALR